MCNIPDRICCGDWFCAELLAFSSVPFSCWNDNLGIVYDTVCFVSGNGWTRKTCHYVCYTLINVQLRVPNFFDDGVFHSGMENSRLDFLITNAVAICRSLLLSS